MNRICAIGFSLFLLVFAACDRPPTNSSSKTEETTSTPSPKQSSTPVRPQSNPKPAKKEARDNSVRLPEVNPLEVEGKLTIAGSSTIFPLSRAIYNRFIDEGYNNIINLYSVGSGDGFKLFCQEGKSDIASASRPITAQELETCKANGRKPVEFQIGVDAIVVVAHPDNPLVKNVTLEELAAIFSEEKWSDVNPQWPNELIQHVIPERGSGTLKVFVQALPNVEIESLLNAPHTISRDSGEELVTAVSSNQYAIGVFGYPFYRPNSKTLKLLSIEGTTPNAQTVSQGQYILARPLFLYSDANLLRQKPQVAAFLNFFLTHAKEEMALLGYFPGSLQDRDRAKLNFLEALGLETAAE